jgi:phenylpropionate dioxygenase-like ring-hydroxylating dioxygenase large terminal subunit
MGLMPAKSFEDLLGDACETLLGKGASEIAAFVAGLNEMCVAGPRGERWTEALLRRELARLSEREDANTGAASDPVVTQPAVPAPASVDDVLRTGLLDMWYLVARSKDVGDRPKALKRLSRNLVLWRDAAGAVHALEDYCPHRGAPLSLGTVVEGRVSCAYHGFEIDATGTIAAVPATADCPLVGRQSVRVYPVREIAGAIFVYFSDQPAVEPPEPALPEELTSPEWSSFLFTTEWRCNWQVALDNRVDPIHGSFLHTGTFTLGYGRKDAELQVEKTEHGFQTVRDNQRGVNIDWHEVDFRPGNMLLVRTEIPYPPSAGGGSFRINGHPTPIDERRTFVWFFRSRKISGWQRELWRFLYVNRLEARAFTVVEQDRVMLEAIPLEARRREALVQSDIAVGRLRRLVRAEAERQLAARSSLPNLPATASL